VSENSKHDWLTRIGQMIGLKPQQAGVVKIVAVGLAIGLLFMQAPTLFGVSDSGGSPRRPPDATEVTAPPDTTRDELSQLERDYAANLERSLSLVAGAGNVHVTLYLASGQRAMPLTDVRAEKTTANEDAADGSTRVTTTVTTDTHNVMTKSGSADVPAMAARNRAEIAGVLIVADGAGSSVVKERLFQSARTALGIPANKIQVVPSDRR
jgi:stage III sporulation protein AG